MEDAQRVQTWTRINLTARYEYLFSEPGLSRLHSHSFHPSSQDRFDILNLAPPNKATAEMKTLVDAVPKDCTKYKVYGAKPYWFGVSIPAEEVNFNHKVLIDLHCTLAWQSSRTSRHMYPRLLVNATFINSKSASDLWLAFIECLTTIYAGIPIS